MNKHSPYAETYTRRRYLRYVLPIGNPDKFELECGVSVGVAPSIYLPEIHYAVTRKSTRVCTRAPAQSRVSTGDNMARHRPSGPLA